MKELLEEFFGGTKIPSVDQFANVANMLADVMKTLSHVVKALIDIMKQLEVGGGARGSGDRVPL